MMDIYESLKLWAALSPCQQLTNAEVDDHGGESEGLEEEQSSISNEFCNPVKEDGPVR
jgi:hypothetical protein